MPWVELNGERKKVACGPCIRGHRSSKCEHKDRVLLEVRKPGRPLSSCPHPPGSCSCERVVINYTVPTRTDCKCTSSNSTPTGPIANPISSANGTHRVQKTRAKRASTSITPATVARALKASDSIDSDASRNGDSTVLINSSESSTGGSPSSSQISDAETRQTGVKQESGIEQDDFAASSCCKPTRQEPRNVGGEAMQHNVPKAGSCCAPKPVITPTPVVPSKKSCCGSKKPEPSTSTNTQLTPRYENIPQFGHGQPAYGAQMQSHGPTYVQPPPHFGGYPQNGHHTPTSPYGIAPSGMVAQQNSYFAHAPHFQANHTAPMMAHGLSAAEHNCNCGDGCTCLGCAMHPRNDTTMEYIRHYSQYLLGQRPQHVTYQNPYASPVGHGMPPYAHGHLPMTNGIPNGQDMSQLYLPNHTYTEMSSMTSSNAQPWPNQSSLQATPVSEMHHFHFGSPNGHDGTMNSPQMAHTPSDRQNTPTSRSQILTESVEDDNELSPIPGSPTLSPSTFFLQSLELPGCDDPTGTCQCGDGCACVGCLTHGGHTGEALDAALEQEPLQFSPPQDMSTNFTTAPG